MTESKMELTYLAEKSWNRLYISEIRGELGNVGEIVDDDFNVGLSIFLINTSALPLETRQELKKTNIK